MTQIWAHRGASADAPENTLPAFALALGQGADGIELDVQLTRDDEVVVIHDETLERTTTGHGWVLDHSYDQLRRLDASGGRPGFDDVRIPLLAEVLDLVRDGTATVNVELKTDVVTSRALPERVLAVVRDSGVQDRVMFSSFNHYTLRDLRKLGAEQPLGALISDRLYKPWKYAESLGVGALHPPVRSCTRRVVEKAHEHGIAVNVWTVNAPGDLRKQIARGVDAVITDVPERALALRDELTAAG